MNLYHYNNHNHTDNKYQYWGTWLFSCFASSITEADKKFEKVFGYSPSTNFGVGCQIFFGESNANC